MASGITHILLMKNLQIILPNGGLKKVLQSGRDFLQVGAVGPDLPYASIADGDLIFSIQDELADKFHYEKTNQLILKAFDELKEIPGTPRKKEKRLMFCFFLGFASHIIADGIIHPFVRDKVGDYHENQTAHRVLEMQLDVLLFHHLTKNTGFPINLNNSEIHDELLNFNINIDPIAEKALQLFSDLISDVYGLNYDKHLINGWVSGLHRMFGVAEGEHPNFYRIFSFINNFLFEDYDDLRDKYESILVLKKPVDRAQNFLRKNSVHFFDDCIPKFNEIFIPLAQKCFEYVFYDGERLTEFDIPPIDLDTGRDLAHNNNLDLTPTLWGYA